MNCSIIKYLCELSDIINVIGLNMSEQEPIHQIFLEKIGRKIQGIVNESRMPTEGFESTVGFYGGELITDPEGRLVYDIRGQVSNADRWGDPKIRTYDEHLMKYPLKLLRRHPSWFLRFIHPGPKRYRGTKQQILAHMQELGLDEYYGSHPWGIEVKKPEIFQKGLVLQDIFRQDLIHSDRLNGIDRFQALAASAQYMRTIHDQHGAIGEPLPSDFIFQTREGNIVKDPVLNIPDIIYNPNKQFGRTEQKATDMLDFLVSLGLEEQRRSGDLKSVTRVLETIVDNYGDIDVIRATGSLAKRGRLTLQGLAFYLHNRGRLHGRSDIAKNIRDLVIKTCDKFVT